MTFFRKDNNLNLGAVTDQYADIFIHVEENGLHSFIKANKVILASHSPYCHRVFQSRENVQNVDMVFVGMKAFLVREALRMMYGQTIKIAERHLERFCEFLQLLEFAFENSVVEEEGGAAHMPKKRKLSTDVHPECTTAPDGVVLDDVENQDKTCENISVSSTISPVKSTVQQPGVSTEHRSEKRTETTDILTETSESGLNEELDKIDFKLGISSSGHHSDYICCHCGRSIKSLVQAKIHFVDNHQNSDAEKRCIVDIMKSKANALGEFEKLKDVINNGGNNVLAVNQLKTIVENLHMHKETLKQLKEKNLPPNLIRKRIDISKSIVVIINNIETFIPEQI